MKIRYGLSSLGAPVHIDSPNVKRGLACDCTCPSCGVALVARQGDERIHHFAHHAQSAELCSYATETELHIRAKALIEQRQQVNIPLHITSCGFAVYKTYPVTNVRLEKFHTGKKPDLIVTINGFDCLIEIAVTHFADNEKRRAYRDNLLNAIEIDLSALKDTEDNELEQVLEEALFGQDSPVQAYWLSLNPMTPFFTEARKTLREETDQAIKAYNDTLAATRNLEMSVISLVNSYKELGIHHVDDISEGQTKILMVGKLDFLIQTKQHELFELKQRSSELSSSLAAVTLAERQISKKKNEIRNHYDELKRQRHALAAEKRDMAERHSAAEAGINKKESEIASREAFICQTESNLRDHSLSLEDIESILDEKSKLSAFHAELKSHGLSLSDVQGLSEYLKKLGNMDQLLADRLQVAESQIQQHNDKIQRLQLDIKELVGQKNYYLQEVAKLHRDLKQSTQSAP